jgi:glycosyltransferase involved in cell wall biosynthesis
MILWIASIMGLILAGLPVMMYLRNLPLFQSVRRISSSHRVNTDSLPKISVLIPARNEADGIEAAIDAALSSTNVEVEVIVLDDHSTDATAEIVQRKCKSDRRVRYSTSRALPPGWNGKQYACRQLADLATHSTFVFIDADVRLSPSAISTLIAYRDQSGTHLVSAFPRQITGTILEQAIIPIMHFVLLGYLPMDRMRASHSPAYAAGCGQLFLTDRQSYLQAGTHEAIAQSRHDGLKLPRAYRLAGLRSDVVDGADLATCRMYTSASTVMNGVLKNAIEGIANPRLIVLFTVLLLGGTVLPIVTLILSLEADRIGPTLLSLVAVILSHLPRSLAAFQLKQSRLGAMLHVPATILFVALQWIALGQHMLGRQVSWRGRS